MIYIIKDKPHIALMSYYREVEIKKEGKDYSVKVKKDSERIERKSTDNYLKLSVEEAYKKTKSSFRDREM